MGSSDSTHFSGMLEKKRRSSRDVSIIHLVGAVLLMSMFIYLWILMGCPWTAKSYLCQDMSLDYVSVLRSNMQPQAKLQKDDFTKLINLDNFIFLINNLLICNDSDPVLTVFVHSHPNHFIKRSIIRNTWGSVVSSRFKLLFLVGIPESERLQNSLDEENKLNRDLIQGNFIDAYRNMTYKHVMGLKWVNYFCPNTKYILKTDDDVFINTPALLEYISKHLLPYSVKNLLLCSPISNSRVKRSSRSKWKVTFPEYSFSMYPTYCEGFAILYSPDVAYTLYVEAQAGSYFWIDDVHITGLLAAKANVKHSSFGSSLLAIENLDDFLKSGAADNSYLIGPFNLKDRDITLLWEKVLQSNTNETRS